MKSQTPLREPRPAKSPETENGQKANILLVDDHEENLFTLEAILKDLNQNLVKARSGKEALKHLLNQNFAVVLLDVKMPEMDGFETALMIRERDKSRDTPIIFVSGIHMQESHIFKGYALGAVDYIVKPFVPEILKSKVTVFVDLMKKTELIKRQVEELKRAEEKFRAVAETASDAIISTNNRGNIIYFNRAAEQIFGYSAGEVADRPLSLLMPERFQEAHQAGFQRYLSTRKPSFLGRTVELIGKRKDGNEFPLEVSLATWKINEESYFTAILRDITDRKQTEAALKKAHEELELRVKERTAELSHSNSELEQFAYVISHDLQEPLRMVTSYAQLLEKRYKEQLDSNASRFINYMVDGAVRMKELIQDLLDYGRINSQPKAFSTVDCAFVFDKAVDNMKVAIREKNASVQCDPLPKVTGDFAQLVALFQNLIMNSLKFNNSPQPAVHVSAKSNAQEYVFSVRDNGIGIEPQYQKRIFEVFQRLHTREEYEGTGIGLAVCKKIVERCGGSIWVDSQLGEGSTFSFTIPLNKEG